MVSAGAGQMEPVQSKRKTIPQFLGNDQVELSPPADFFFFFPVFFWLLILLFSGFFFFFFFKEKFLLRSPLLPLSTQDPLNCRYLQQMSCADTVHTVLYRNVRRPVVVRVWSPAVMRALASPSEQKKGKK